MDTSRCRRVSWRCCRCSILPPRNQRLSLFQEARLALMNDKFITAPNRFNGISRDFASLSRRRFHFHETNCFALIFLLSTFYLGNRIFSELCFEVHETVARLINVTITSACPSFVFSPRNENKRFYQNAKHQQSIFAFLVNPLSEPKSESKPKSRQIISNFSHFLSLRTSQKIWHKTNKRTSDKKRFNVIKRLAMSKQIYHQADLVTVAELQIVFFDWGMLRQNEKFDFDRHPRRRCDSRLCLFVVLLFTHRSRSRRSPNSR